MSLGHHMYGVMCWKQLWGTGCAEDVEEVHHFKMWVSVLPDYCTAALYKASYS